jgi:neurocalcin delta
MGKSQSKISKEDMDFLQQKTDLDKSTIEEWYEGFLKDCPSGELSKEKFIAMYSKIFPSGNADNFSQNIFRTFDTNNSGTIDFREFMLALHVTSGFS